MMMPMRIGLITGEYPLHRGGVGDVKADQSWVFPVGGHNVEVDMIRVCPSAECP